MHNMSKGMVTEGLEQMAESDTCSMREVTKILLYTTDIGITLPIAWQATLWVSGHHLCGLKVPLTF